MKIELIQGDITSIPCDAIVNAANSKLVGGGGVDGAIHRVGGTIIAQQCAEIRQQSGGCPTGEAVYTDAGNLPARFVIHTVGPIWQGGMKNEPELLANCYRNSLLLADRLGVKSITFPNISTGVYGYPKEEAAEIAIRTVQEFADKLHSIEKVIFVCFDSENVKIYRALLSQ